MCSKAAGDPPTIAKKTLDEHHIATATADRLKSVRTRERLSDSIQNDITSASSATIATPTSVPNMRTEVSTNASDTEIRTSSDGSLTLNVPVRRVSAARI